jgi:hypothetical protein
MRYTILFALTVLLSSCGKQVLNEAPLGYSFMPGYLDVDSIQPVVLDDTTRVVDSTLDDFVSIAIDSGIGMLEGEKMPLPGGVLISDRKAALYPFYRSSWERQQKELRYVKYLMKEYYDKSVAAEKLYQEEIVRWKKEAQRSWLEKNMGYIGFGAGLAVAVAMSFVLSM